MDVDRALILVDVLLQGQKLKDIQEQVFRYSWSGWTYPEIAEQIGYDTGHTRDVGSKLWQQISQAVGEQVTKKNLQTVLRRQLQQKLDGCESSTLIQVDLPRQATPQEAWRSPAVEGRQYWGEAIDVSVFYGRTTELSLLEQWILQDRCRIVTVLGMGGMGKTTLVTRLAHILQHQFDILIWQSLRNAPALENILSQWIQLLLGSSTISTAIETQIDMVMAGLRSHRCLLILDNLDTILSNQTGYYREGYEAYGELLRRIGVEQHSSHLLITSREHPKSLATLEGEALPIRSLRLTGLEVIDIQVIGQTSGCVAETEQEWQTLTRQYSGNPLAIKIISTVVRNLFDGKLTHFLQQGAISFGDIRLLLDEHFQRLSILEQHILYWLAISREWVSLSQLRAALVPFPLQSTLLEALLSLWQRSLIEQHAGRFTLQPVVMEYVTEQFLDRVFTEIKNWHLEPENGYSGQSLNHPLFSTHALIQAQTEDYLRESQIRVLLAPLTTRLKHHFLSPQNLEQHLQRVLSKLRQQSLAIGYAAGNLINLLHQLGVSLKGYDFSHLPIRQACLQHVELHQTNFTNAQFSESMFTETLAMPLSLAFSSTGDHLASGDLNSEVRLWRVEDGENVWIGKGHEGWVWSIAFSSDGKWLASGSEDRTVKLWDLEAGSCSRTLEGHSSPIWCVAFNSNGQWLASGSEDWTVKLWNVYTGHCLKTLRGHQNWVRSVAFSPSLLTA